MKHHTPWPQQAGTDSSIVLCCVELDFAHSGIPAEFRVLPTIISSPEVDHMTIKMAASWKKIRGTLKPSYLLRFVVDPSKAWFVMLGLLLAECVVNIFVIQRIKCKLVGSLTSEAR